jgi:tetratricopeptide (TPR) repeat protein
MQTPPSAKIDPAKSAAASFPSPPPSPAPKEVKSSEQSRTAGIELGLNLSSAPATQEALTPPGSDVASQQRANLRPEMQQVTGAIAGRVKQAKDLRNAEKFPEALKLLDLDFSNLSPLDSSEIMLWRGKILQFSKNIPPALDSLVAAEEQASKISNPFAQPRQLAYVIFQHGMALRAGNDLEGALRMFSKAEPYLRDVGGNDTVYSLADRCDMNHNLAFTLEQRGMEQEAIEAYIFLLPLRIEAGQLQPLGYTYARLGALQCKVGERDEGRKNLRKGIELIDAHGSKTLADTYRATLATYEEN